MQHAYIFINIKFVYAKEKNNKYSNCNPQQKQQMHKHEQGDK